MTDSDTTRRLPPFIEVLRPGHWVKNGIVLLPIVFGLKYKEAEAWALCLLAVLTFCLVSSFTYILNDLFDRRSDQHHFRKRSRPIASGRLSPRTALAEMLVLAACVGGLLIAVGELFACVIGAYLLLQLAYNLLFKRHVLADAICLACGFVLRAVGGAVAVHVAASAWLIVCTFFLALFLAFCKRQCEIVTVGGASAPLHRRALAGYTPALLNHLITLSGAVTVVSFLLYAMSPHTLELFGTRLFIGTIPLVVYGIGRIAMLSMAGAYADPTELLLRDRPVQLTAAAWVTLAAAIVAYGRPVQEWLLAHLAG